VVVVVMVMVVMVMSGGFLASITDAVLSTVCDELQACVSCHQTTDREREEESHRQRGEGLACNW